MAGQILPTNAILGRRALLIVGWNWFSRRYTQLNDGRLSKAAGSDRHQCVQLLHCKYATFLNEFHCTVLWTESSLSFGL